MDSPESDLKCCKSYNTCKLDWDIGKPRKIKNLDQSMLVGFLNGHSDEISIYENKWKCRQTSINISQEIPNLRHVDCNIRETKKVKEEHVLKLIF